MAHEIIGFFPSNFRNYYEPFLGSGAVLGTLAPKKAVGADIFKPLVEIWQTLQNSPEKLKEWYSERLLRIDQGIKAEEYEKIKASYNKNPNGADLLFLCRSCYGGVVRFRQSDGYMSTPCGIHTPISFKEFSNRVDLWRKRTENTMFLNIDYQEAFDMAKPGDLIYCDPPYIQSQSILYGAQKFDFQTLLLKIEQCKTKGIYVALSIDGTKKSGDLICNLQIPKGLFTNEIFLNCGRSMLKRFQMEGKSLETEVVSDRLLLTY